MSNGYAACGHLSPPFSEERLEQWVSELRAQVTAGPVSLGLVFVAQPYVEKIRPVLEILRIHGRIPLLVGCGATRMIANGLEVEDQPGLSLGLYHLPGASLRAVHVPATAINEGLSGPEWIRETGIAPENVNAWLLLADPYQLQTDRWLDGWNAAYAPRPVVGALSTGATTETNSELFCNGATYDNGVLAVAVGGDVTLLPGVSQGCTPIGEPFMVTRAERNIILFASGKPAFQALASVFDSMPEGLRRRARGNLFIGLANNEYVDEFRRGDFLIRNIFAADSSSGALAIGAYPRVGQTFQFHIRDAAAATEDMAAMLEQQALALADRPLYGAALFLCNGRGERLFGHPNHDTTLLQRRFPELPTTGCFAAGEVGPVAGRAHLHGYAASLGLFTSLHSPTSQSHFG